MSRSLTAAHSRLILVDGFAGSGKSTTAQRLWLQLIGRGRAASWFHEHQAAHPILCYDEVEELLELEMGSFEDRILASWTAFALQDDGSAIRILEGSFFQLTVGVMLAMNVSARRIERTLLEIERIIRPLDPVLVHLFHRDTREGVLRIRDHRGGYWLDGMTTILGRSPYGQRHRVRDVEGLIRFYERQRAILDSVLAKLALRRIGIEIGRGRWTDYERRMAAYLKCGSPLPLGLSSSQSLRYVGRYAGETRGPEWIVTTDGAALYLQEPLTPAQRLLPVGSGEFAVESLPIQLRFGSDKSGKAREMTVENRLINAKVPDTVFTRVKEKRSSR